MIPAQDRFSSDEPAAVSASGPSAGPQKPQHTAWDIPRPEPMWKMPTTLTSLIGREQLVNDICILLSRPEIRLLTLLGPGGIGKSRVAIQVANALRHAFADGVCFVPLAKISDPTLVIPAIAQELGIQEQLERSDFEQVQVWLREKQFLLLLDNFEQVVTAAPLIEELYALCPLLKVVIEELYALCPLLKVVVTSRAVLHVQGEQEFPVPPLALPDLRRLSEDWVLSPSTAVTLFVQRAQSTLPTFQLTQTNVHAIIEICVRLDGLPLAIELAAARIKLLPPHALLARLSQRLQVLGSGAQATRSNGATTSYLPGNNGSFGGSASSWVVANFRRRGPSVLMQGIRRQMYWIQLRRSWTKASSDRGSKKGKSHASHYLRPCANTVWNACTKAGRPSCCNVPMQSTTWRWQSV